MYCNECLDHLDKYHVIGDNKYCYNCIDKFMLIKCPGSMCNNTVSLNGYDLMDDTDYNTCNICDAIFCNSCLKRDNMFKMCKDCLNS